MTTITKQAGILNITIHAIKHLVSILSAVIGIAALLYFYHFLTKYFIDSISNIWNEPFNLFFVGFILFSFITTGYELLWLLFGKEQIVVNKNQLTVKKQIFGLGVN